MDFKRKGHIFKQTLKACLNVWPLYFQSSFCLCFVDKLKQASIK